MIHEQFSGHRSVYYTAILALCNPPPPPGSLHQLSTDPMKVVNKAVVESTGWLNMLLTFASNLVAPEDEESMYAHTHQHSFSGRNPSCVLLVSPLTYHISPLCILGNLYAVRKKGLYSCNHFYFVMYYMSSIMSQLSSSIIKSLMLMMQI